MPTTQLDADEVRVLRVLAGGRKVLPIRDAPFEANLSSKGLIEYGTTFHGGAVPDLSAAGVATLLEIDGPLTEAERADWLRWPKTRFGTDGVSGRTERGV